MPSSPGIHLVRTAENADEIDALAGLLGGRVGVEAVLGDLDRHGRHSWLPLPAVHEAFTFDAADRRDRRWWPQGVTTSADASESGTVGGRRLVVVAWYAKQLRGDPSNHGARITLFDLDTRRYRHVLLVVPRLEDGVPGLSPLRVHAGGLVWHGPYLHVAATAKGFFTFRLDDLLRVPDAAGDPADELGVREGRVASHGYRYVLPARFAYRARTDEGEERLRYSFLSLDRSASPPALIAGEYARRRATRRLVSFPLDTETLLPATDEHGASRPLGLGEGVGHMQGAVLARSRYHVTVSHGPFMPGSVYVGRPGALRRHHFATPMGPEDIAYWPETDLLWSVTEHRWRRWIFSMRRARFD